MENTVFTELTQIEEASLMGGTNGGNANGGRGGAGGRGARGGDTGVVINGNNAGNSADATCLLSTGCCVRGGFSFPNSGAGPVAIG